MIKIKSKNSLLLWQQLKLKEKKFHQLSKKWLLKKVIKYNKFDLNLQTNHKINFNVYKYFKKTLSTIKKVITKYIPNQQKLSLKRKYKNYIF